MSLQFNLVKVAAIVAVLSASVAGIHFVGAAQENKAKPIPQTHLQPGEVKFAPNAPQLSLIKVATVSEVPLPVSEPFNGRITYDENVTARVTSPIAGRVLSSHVEVGDEVHRGTVLTEIDSPDFATAEADWRKAQADELRKKLAFDRAKTLFEGEVIARKDYESAEADYQQAKAETKRASLRMKSLNAVGKENGEFSLKSPIAGMVADKQINPGLEVRPDLPNPLFVITDLDRLWVMVDVPERNAAAIHAGQTVTLETDAYPDERFSATVDRVGLVLDPGTRRIQVRCSVRNSGHKLKPEMFARVSFLTDDHGKTAIPVPNTSLFIDGLYSYVFVEKRDGVFVKQRVNVAMKGHDKSFIDAGLANAERVVTEGAFLLNAEVAGDAQ
ncbi:efflux RND transporter periplasmic adaptor subunit [Sulfurirhabdus autotrophica]|uniref:Cobalt-zinc-cadmium efflux system membrane fusion protein n=1 Tax=Sulfurirhabdus autotrophica TaxID=1706046 RepID=A0A4R3YCG3_9PROT|nr:efflux RND transporter periplasmic adaptor subunit [Sulfurirhabdus autotrophica]TCV89680.1 cobalt-zinc-cadmium efflux system membrane fusion protein [Sulfurirhabdus autotrophica]